MLAIVDKCFALQNNITYSASLVHMDYECLTYVSAVVITYAMHVLCTACMYIYADFRIYGYVYVCM